MECGTCGNANPAGAKFCNECGTPLAQEAGQEVRKTITVLFADLVGFTSLSERLDQESLRRVMDRFYEEMRGAVHAHGGTVAKFIGDAVMAVWGTPVVREDDALRAVRAAEAMRGALAALNGDLETRWGVRVGMRTGVNTGEVVVDPTKSADLLVGDTLNVAARLEQTAADGEVLVGPDTYRLVRDQAALEPVEPLHLKGKARRLPAFRLVAGERRSSSRLRAPLVGRDAELARLRAAFDTAVTNGETRLVTVVGSPGLGKSRLAAELAARLAAEARVLRGHCEPATEGATFLPVAEVLREAAALDGDADDLRARLVAATPGVEDRVADALAALLGDGELVGAEETFWAVRRFLETVARERPLVVLLDDVHWGEPTFLELIEHLVEWGRDAPILLVALARPELRDSRPTLCDEREGEVLALDPLPADASRALVDGLLGAADLPAALAERLLETADGNPLFLGEMLRMLVDDGVLRREGDSWAMAGAEDVTVPPTIHALLAARLERLPDGERKVAQRAAIIGPQFTRAAVTELVADPDVGAHLDALRRKELVVTVDDDTFRFGHALIRDAAYRPLLKESRADLHQRFAEWLEARGDEQDEIVGFHLERAFGYRRELGPLDDAGRDLGRRAGARLLGAGRRALAREDLPAATNLLGRALDVLDDDDPARVEALLEQAEALLSAGDTARAGDVVEELGLRAASAGDERVAARATVLGGQLANMTGAGGVRETIALLEEAAAVLEAAGDAAGVAKAHHVVAGSHALLGQVAAAEASLDRALVAARAADDRRRVTAVLSGAPRAALWGPSPVVRASGRCLDVVRIVRMTPGNRHVEAMALRCQAVLEAMRGRAEAGRSILSSGRAALEELGLTLELHELDVYAGTVELLAGDQPAAEERLRAARDGFAALGVETGAAQAAALLARAVLEQGRDEDAIELTAFAERRGGEDLKTAIAWRGVRAEALARRGDHDEARRVAREAVALSEPTDALADKADALMALAFVLRAGGDEAGAREAASRARDVYAAKQHEAGLARAAELLGQVPATSAAPPAEPAATLGDSPPERLARRWVQRINAEDWDGLRALYAEDCVTIDRTGDGADIEGADAIVRALRDARDLIGDFEWRVTKVLAVADLHIALVVELVTDSVAGGGPGVLGYAQVVTLGGDRIERFEMFKPDDREAVLARFEEIRAAERDATPIEALAREFERCFNERDWAALRALFAPGFTRESHLRVDLWSYEDEDDLVAQLRAGAEVTPDLRASVEPIAVAGNVMAARHTWTGSFQGGGTELRAGHLVVVRDGLIEHLEAFEPTAEAALLARFEELRRANEPVRLAPGVDPAAPVVEHARRLADAFTRADWDAYGALFGEGFTAEDHRATGGSRLDRETVIATGRTAKESAPDMVQTIEILAASDDLIACVHELRGHARDGGGLLEVRFGRVGTHQDGVLVHAELFDPQDREGILARFDELLVERARSPALRLAAEGQRRFHLRDWDGLRALYADDFVYADRRGMSLWDPIGPDEFLAQTREAVAMTPDMRMTTRLVAGTENVLAVAVTLSATFDGAPMEVALREIVVVRDGLIVRWEDFDADDEAPALARLYELVAEHGPTATHRVIAEYARSYNARDWDRMRATFADDLVNVDHRSLALWGDDGADGIAAGLRQTAELTPDVRLRVDVVAVDGEVAAVHQTWNATFEGAPMEVRVAQVAVCRDGVIARIEQFEPDDDESMRRRFEELRARPGHLAVAARERFVAAFEERDWEALRALQTEASVAVDHRPAGFGEVRGVEPLVALRRNLAEVGVQRWRSTPIATHGSRLALFRDELSSDEPPVTGDAVSLVQVDRDGRIWRTEVFPAEEEAAARERLDRLVRFATLCEAQRHALVGGDWEAMGSTAAPDAYMEYHATGSRFEGRDELVAHWSSVRNGTDRLDGDLDRFDEPRPGVFTRRETWQGETNGAEWEAAQTCVCLLDAEGRMSHIEQFLVDDPKIGEAIERLAGAAIPRA